MRNAKEEEAKCENSQQSKTTIYTRKEEAYYRADPGPTNGKRHGSTKRMEGRKRENQLEAKKKRKKKKKKVSDDSEDTAIYITSGTVTSGATESFDDGLQL